MQLPLDQRDFAKVQALLDAVETTPLAGSSAAALATVRLAGECQAADALDRSDRAQQAFPDDAEIQLQHLALLRAAGRVAEAVAHAEGLVRHLPKPRLLLELAEMQLADGAAEAARETLARQAETLDRLARFYLFQAAISQALGETGAASWLERGGRRFPGNIRLASAYWAALAEAGQRDAAIAACLAFNPEGKTKAATHLARAKFLDRIGATDLFEAEITRARASASGKDATAAEALIARHLFAKGDVSAAIAVLDALPPSDAGMPAILLLRTRLDAAQGEYQAAFARLEPLVNAQPPNPDALLFLARLHTDTGAFEAALAALGALPDRLLARRAVLETRILKDRGLYAEAEAIAEQAAQGRGATRPAVWHTLSDIQAINGHIEAAWQSHQRRVALSSSANLAGRASGKALQSFWGQILNEYRLMSSDEDCAFRAPDADAIAACLHFRRRIEAEPDNIAAAMGLMTILRRTGAISAMPPPVAQVENVIPQRIAQFWESADPPPEIEAFSSHNAAMNPDWDYQLFHDVTARNFLSNHAEPAALVAYSRARLAAEKADIFRLAWLCHRGGVYMDADDKCLTGLDALLDLRLRFVACQEYLTSIGNNFIAAAPNHPILGLALAGACSAPANTSGESIWLAKGPGLLTRAVAAAGTAKDGAFCDGVWIMPAHRLNWHVATALPLGYKTSNAHWVRDLAARRR